MIAQNLGDQPHDILRGAADEVLACLKNDSMTDPERKKETEKLINSITPEVCVVMLALRTLCLHHTHPPTQNFAKLISIGKRITDFMVEDGAGNEKLDDELGVAVVFDEDDEQARHVMVLSCVEFESLCRRMRTNRVYRPLLRDRQDEIAHKEDEHADIVDEDMSEDEEMGFEASDARHLNRGDEVRRGDGAWALNLGATTRVMVHAQTWVSCVFFRKKMMQRAKAETRMSSLSVRSMLTGCSASAFPGSRRLQSTLLTIASSMRAGVRVTSTIH